MVTAVFSMAEMGARIEQARLIESMVRFPFRVCSAADSGKAFARRSHLVCFNPDRRGADDFQQYEQQNVAR